MYYFAEFGPKLVCHLQHWNVRDAAALRRTDFFPGLGWMLSAEVWSSVR